MGITASQLELTPYVSDVNSSEINLTSSNAYTFTGTAELTHHPDLMVNVYADQDTTIQIQFSLNGTISVIEISVL